MHPCIGTGRPTSLVRPSCPHYPPSAGHSLVLPLPTPSLPGESFGISESAPPIPSSCVAAPHMAETSSVRGDRAALLCWWGWGRGAVQVTGTGTGRESSPGLNGKGESPWALCLACRALWCHPTHARAEGCGCGVGCAHHEHEEVGVVRRLPIGCRCDAKCVLLALKALGARAHGVPLQRVQDLLHARSLRPILANAVHCGKQAAGM